MPDGVSIAIVALVIVIMKVFHLVRQQQETCGVKWTVWTHFEESSLCCTLWVSHAVSFMQLHLPATAPATSLPLGSEKWKAATTATRIGWGESVAEPETGGNSNNVSNCNALQCDTKCYWLYATTLTTTTTVMGATAWPESRGVWSLWSQRWRRASAVGVAFKDKFYTNFRCTLVVFVFLFHIIYFFHFILLSMLLSKG